MKAFYESNKLLWVYGYLFYKLYNFIKEPRFKSNGLQYIVVLAITIFLCENFLFLSSLYDIFVGGQSFVFFTQTNNLLGFLFVPIIALNYFIFIYKDRYKGVFKFYASSSAVADIWAWSYIFFSMFGLILIEPVKIIVTNIIKSF